MHKAVFFIYADEYFVVPGCKLADTRVKTQIRLHQYERLKYLLKQNYKGFYLFHKYKSIYLHIT